MIQHNSSIPAEISAGIGHTEKLAFTGKEMQTLLDCSHVTIWRLEKKGLLRPVAGLHKKLYSRAAVDAFLSGSTSKRAA